MLLKILKTKQPLLIIIIPLIAVLLWLKALVGTTDFNINTAIQMPLYQLISPIVNFNIYTSKFFGIVFMLLQAFLLAMLNMKFFFIKQRTYLHTFTYILIISSSVLLQYSSPALIANFFVIFAFDWLFSSYKKYNTNKELFNVGLLLGVGTLFYFNIILLLPFFIIAYLILHTGRLREIFVIIAGFLAPVLVFVQIAFLNDSLHHFINKLEMAFSQMKYHYSFFTKNNIFYLYLIILVLLSFFKFFAIIGTKKIASRKIFSIFLLYIIYLISILIIVPLFDFQILVLLSVPVSYFITDYYINIKDNILAELSFILLIISLVITQFSIFNF